MNVTFEPTLYDNRTLELWGTVNVQGILYTSVIRRVSSGEYETVKDNDAVACSVIGVTATGKTEDKTMQMVLILSRVTNTIKRGTIDLEQNRAGEEMAAKIADEIATFEKDKAENNEHPKFALL